MREVVPQTPDFYDSNLRVYSESFVVMDIITHLFWKPEGYKSANIWHTISF